MPAAMHLTVLLLLFALTLGTDSTTNSTTKLVPQSATGPEALTSSTVGKTPNVVPSTTNKVTTIASSSSPPSTPKTPIPVTDQTSTGIPVADQTSTGIPVINQTSTGIPVINQTSTGIPVINQTSTGIPVINQTSTGIPVINQTSTGIPVTNQTVTNGSTIPPTSGSSYVTANTTVNTTSSALSDNKGDDLASNPGLVAILSIFCIVLVLALVVTAVKCSSSSRNKFERLEDVPMGKVNEGSPFAHYSK